MGIEHNAEIIDKVSSVSTLMVDQDMHLQNQIQCMYLPLHADL